MIVAQVVEMDLGGWSCIATFFTYVNLWSALLVGEPMRNSVHLQRVRLERTALSERLLAMLTLVRPHAAVGADVSLEVEGVVEALAAVGARVALDVRVALHVPVQESLEAELLAADRALERVAVGQVDVGGVGVVVVVVIATVGRRGGRVAAFAD